MLLITPISKAAQKVLVCCQDLREAGLQVWPSPASLLILVWETSAGFCRDREFGLGSGCLGFSGNPFPSCSIAVWAAAIVGPAAFWLLIHAQGPLGSLHQLGPSRGH